MKIVRNAGPLMLLVAAAAFLVASGNPQDASARIKAEIERLQKSLQARPITDKDFGEIGSMANATLKASAEARSAGRLYLSLEKLGQGEDLLQGARAGVDKAPLIKSGLPAFESQWGASSLRLTALDKEAHERTWDRKPIVIRALSESAQGKAIPLLDGSRGFATAKGPKDGLLYMGQAEGEAAFSKFCAALNLRSTKTPFPLRSFLPELQDLQAKANAAFQPPKSIELHDRFIALNSAIKLAEELDSSRFYAGALYEYLGAVRHYAMLDAPVVEAAQQSHLKVDLAAARKKIADSADDDSIAQLFIERAESQIAHADGSAPSADEWRSSRVILDQVLPAYFAARKPAAPVRKADGKTVDITLVRWPYT
jgi:hypothetical protein